MKCSNCFNILISTFRCRFCPKNFCSLNCLEIHCSKEHYEKNNEIDNTQKINSPYLIYGFLNNTISYNPFYSLKNFVPIYDQFGKIRIIGCGSYGQVYLALHTTNKKYYAIKHMDKKKLFSLLHSLSSIQKEIEIQSKIDHPNIVKLLFVKETNISYDLIMEYASTGSLFHYIRKLRGLNEDKTFSLFIQVVNAVNFLHQNDLIHRDIKPENILIYDNNVVRLCDFGWCVKLNGHQRGTFCGTTEYMSPELVNHQGYGKEIDVWSLGILLYEMIHGYSPFRPNKPKFNEKDVMENIKNHNLIFGKKVSNECKELIYHLLDPNINMRYKVEDIYKSEFVKKYEIMHYNYPDYNLVMKYNQKFIKNNNINEININNTKETNENINLNNINKNIIYSEISPQFEIKPNNIYNSIDNLIYSYNNQIQETNKNINNYYKNNTIINKQKNLSSSSLNNVFCPNYINLLNNNYNPIYNPNLSNNYCINNSINNDINNINNNINIVIKNNNIFDQREIGSENEFTNKTANNFYPLNFEKNREKEIIDIYSFHNDDKGPQDSKRDNKQFINFNNNPFLILFDPNKNDNIKQINNNIWNDNQNNNNILQINNEANTQYINLEKENSLTNEQTANKLLENLNNKIDIDNNTNYNYFYNFNNYNNNYTNNFFNNSHSSISVPNLHIKKGTNMNNNNNIPICLNNNYNNSTINSICIIDKNKTSSTINTTSNKNKIENKNLNKKGNILKKASVINNEKSFKTSKFEIGEEKYNISEKDQNESDSSSIKINDNNENQIIKNRKYLSKSDYSIINKKKRDIGNIKKLEIKNMKLQNINKTLSVHIRNPHNNFNNFNDYTNRIINKKEEMINLKHNSIQKNISFNNLKAQSLQDQNNKNKKNTISYINLIDDKMKILDENKDNIKIHEIKVVNMFKHLPKSKQDNEPQKNINKNISMKNIISKKLKSNSYCGNNNIIVEINDKSRENKINNEDKKKVIEKIKKEKKNYINTLKKGNINKNSNNKNIIKVKKDNNNSSKNISIGDVLCSLFHAFDSKEDQINEISISRKDINNKNIKINQNINKKITNKVSLSPECEKSKLKSNSLANINPIKKTNKLNSEKNNSKYLNKKTNNKDFKPKINSNSNKNFIKLSNNNNQKIINNNSKIQNIEQQHLENSHSEININKNYKSNNLENTQSNPEIKPIINTKNNINNTNKVNIDKKSYTNINSNIIFDEFKKEGHSYPKKLISSISSSNITTEKKKLNKNNKIESNKNNLIREIPIDIKNKNKENINNSNIPKFSDLCDSNIITPKKGNIFNRVNPIKLLGAFKKELTSFSIKEKKFNYKAQNEKNK